MGDSFDRCSWARDLWSNFAINPTPASRCSAVAGYRGRSAHREIHTTLMGPRGCAKRRGAARSWMVTAFVILRVLVLAALVGPFTAEAQPAGRLPRVGVIWEGATTPSPATGFRQGLRELGYTEGQNIIIEDRHTAGRFDQVPKLATELIALGVDVLVVFGTTSAQSAKAVTSTVPIVFALAGDPVGSGLVASLASRAGTPRVCRTSSPN